MSANVNVRSLSSCLRYLAENKRLLKAHSVDARSGKNSDRYTTFFIVPTKRVAPEGCFDIDIKAVLHQDRDAALVAKLTQDVPGDKFDVIVYEGVSQADAARALRTFVAANSMKELDEEPEQATTIFPKELTGKTWESANKRPLPGSNIDDVIKFLEQVIDNVPVKVMNKALGSSKVEIKDVLDELRWVANRWNVFEYGLIRIAQGTTCEELNDILEKRSSVLYWLFDRDNAAEGPTNEEIIELCKKSNNPKFTNAVTFNIPAGYKGGEPLKLMNAALDAIRVYERNYGPFIPQPEYLIVMEQEDGGTRRFVNPDWVEWWTEYSDRIVHPLDEVTTRLRESFKDRPHLTALDVRVKHKPEVHEIFNDDVPRHEVIVSYQAFL